MGKTRLLLQISLAYGLIACKGNLAFHRADKVQPALDESSPQAVSPTQPTALKLVAATPYTTKRVQLYWEQASDTLTPPSELQYLVFYSTSDNIATVDAAETLGTKVGDWSPGITTQTITGLNPNTTYWFTVLVKNNDGLKTAYASVQRKTDNFCVPDAGDGSGSGVGNEIYICDVMNLNSVREAPDKFYLLKTSLDMSETASWNAGAGFEPIGTETQPFTGNINGNSKYITKLHINRPSEKNVGLIGYASGATFKLFGLKSVSISGGENVGVIGQIKNGTIESVWSDGAINSNSGYTGGVTGRQDSTSILRAFSMATITSDGAFVGGLIGYLSGAATGDVARSFATGSVRGSSSVGGLVGQVSSARTIQYSYATGNANGTSDVGGLVGANESGIVSSSWASGNVVSGSRAGGLVGSNSNGAQISYSFAEGHVAATGNDVGGAVGLNSASTVTGLLATGKLSASGSTKGTVIGRNTGASAVTLTLGHDRSSSACVGQDDTATAVCSHVTTGTTKSFDPVKFDPVFKYVKEKLAESKNMRKISLRNEKAYKVWGTCNSLDAAINITGAVSAITTCKDFNWQVTLDFSGLADGSHTIAVNQNGTNSQSLTLTKETDFCRTNTTDNVHGYAGPSANNGTTSGLAYRICTLAQFEKMRDVAVEDLYFRLMDDLDVLALERPLGSSGSCTTEFCKMFDGNGFTLSGLRMLRPTASNTSIFGESSQWNSPRNSVRNLGIEDSVAIGNGTTGLLVGNGSYFDLIDNYVSGAVIGVGGNAGGMAGRWGATATNAGLFSAAHVINASSNGGGLVGYPGATITRSYAIGNVTGTGSFLGGLTGGEDGPVVSQSFATGNVISSLYGGGLIAHNHQAGNVTDSYATGSVLGAGNSKGGLIGIFNFDTDTNTRSIQRSYASGNVISAGTAGGLVGVLNSQNKSISNSFSVGAVTSSAGTSGGFVGSKSNQAGVDVSGSYYWNSAVNPAVCIGNDGGAAPSGCTSVVGATLPSRFTGTFGDVPGAPQAPMNAWDFATTPVWKYPLSGGLPLLNWQLDE